MKFEEDDFIGNFKKSEILKNEFMEIQEKFWNPYDNEEDLEKIFIENFKKNNSNFDFKIEDEYLEISNNNIIFNFLI